MIDDHHSNSNSWLRIHNGRCLGWLCQYFVNLGWSPWRCWPFWQFGALCARAWVKMWYGCGRQGHVHRASLRQKGSLQCDVQDVFGSLIWCALSPVSCTRRICSVFHFMLCDCEAVAGKKGKDSGRYCGVAQISLKLPCRNRRRGWLSTLAQVTTVAINSLLVWRRPPAALGWAQIKRKHWGDWGDWFGSDSLAFQEGESSWHDQIVLLVWMENWAALKQAIWFGSVYLGW